MKCTVKVNCSIPLKLSAMYLAASVFDFYLVLILFLLVIMLGFCYCCCCLCVVYICAFPHLVPYDTKCCCRFRCFRFNDAENEAGMFSSLSFLYSFGGFLFLDMSVVGTIFFIFFTAPT